MFNISKLVNKITDRGSREVEPVGSSGGGSMSFVHTEEQHSEGFLCPQCMVAFPSPEALEAHYNASHGQNEVSAHGSSDDDFNNGGDGDLKILKDQIQNLQLCLAEEKLTAEELKDEVLKLHASYEATGENQGKQFQNDKALLNSEVALLRKQLTDSLEEISTIKKDKEKIIAKNETLQSETVSLKSNVANLEAQLTHKNSIDDAAVLKLELVSVQRMMDQLSLEKDKQIEELQAKIQSLGQSNSVTPDLASKLQDSNAKLNSLSGTVDTQRLEIDKLKSDNQIELKKSSEQLTEVNSQLSEVIRQKSELEQQCGTLTEEVKRLNDQLADLYQKFEGGEGAKAALEALQKENELLRENISSLNQKNSDMSSNLQKHEAFAEISAAHVSKLKSEVERLKSSETSMMATITELEKMRQETLAQIQIYEVVSAELDELRARHGKLESKLATTEEEVKDKDNAMAKIKAEHEFLAEKLAMEFNTTKERFENDATALQSKYQIVLKEKENFEKKVHELTSEKDKLLSKTQVEENVIQALKTQVKTLEQTVHEKVHYCNEVLKTVDEIKQAYTEVQETHEDLQKRKDVIEADLLAANSLNSELQEKHSAQVSALEGQLKLEKETYNKKLATLEDSLSLVKQEQLETQESLKKMSEQEKETKERLGVVESELQKATFNLTENENETKALKAQTDTAVKDKIEFEKRYRSNEDEKSLLLEKCLTNESEMDQLQQKINGMQRKLDDSYAALQELGRENQSLQMESAKLQGRKWADDSVVTNCNSAACTKEFSLTIRKHHCRHCGQIFCGDCSSRTAAVPSCKKPARVCDACYQELLVK